MDAETVYQIPKSYVKQLKACSETVYTRIRRLPADMGSVIDEVCHVGVDVVDRSFNSFLMVKKLLVNDLTAIDAMCCGRASRHGHYLMAETYFWMALCCLGFECGEAVGHLSYLETILDMMLHQFNALILVFVVLPFFVFTYLRKSLVSDDTRRMWTLAFSFLMGLLMSYGYPPVTTVGTPPLFILPFVLGWVSCCNAFYSRNANTRVLFVFFCWCIPFAVYSFYGFLIGYQHGCWTLTMSVTAVVDLQLKIGRLSRRWSAEALEQWSSLVIFWFAHTICRLGSHMLGVGVPKKN